MNLKIILIASLASCLGCASPMQTARMSYAAASAMYDKTEPQIEARYEQEQRACLQPLAAPEPCVAAVRARWLPVRKAAEVMYVTLLAAGASLEAYGTLAGGGRAPTPGGALGAVERLLDAADALSKAVLALEAK